MPRERIELPCLRLQCNALTAKPPKLFDAAVDLLWQGSTANRCLLADWQLPLLHYVAAETWMISSLEPNSSFLAASP